MGFPVVFPGHRFGPLVEFWRRSWPEGVMVRVVELGSVELELAVQTTSVPVTFWYQTEKVKRLVR